VTRAPQERIMRGRPTTTNVKAFHPIDEVTVPNIVPFVYLEPPTADKKPRVVSYPIYSKP